MRIGFNTTRILHIVLSFQVDRTYFRVGVASRNFSEKMEKERKRKNRTPPAIVALEMQTQQLELENVEIANALQLEVARRHASLFPV